MEKFGMSFGGGPSKKELLDTIEGQRKQLLQYQARLKDVVRAYKSLLKEKEALEASLKVLSVSQEADACLDSTGTVGAVISRVEPTDDLCSVHSEDSIGTSTSVDTGTSVTSAKGELPEEDTAGVDVAPVAGTPVPRSEEASGSESGVSTASGEGTAAAGDSEKKYLQLKAQLATLTSALATVTQEKSRMEASYQADKKLMKQEMEELSKMLETEKGSLEVELRVLQEQLVETKARLITQQHDRAQEQSDHALMLRELQKLLQEERDLRQDCELRLEETREVLASRVDVAERVEGYEARARQLSQVLEELRSELRAVQEERHKPDPRVQQLQDEMAGVKKHFQMQLLQEMRKVALADEQLRQHSQMEEQRVASLESQISEVSELLGTYEKAKQKDQMAIQKLKERIVQLDMENKTLAIAASSRSLADLNVEESSLDINVLKDKMEKLKKLLHLAAKRSPRPLDIEKLCEIELAEHTEAADGEKASALYYQQELKQLKEEFERYKMRAQVVLKNKTSKDGHLGKELEDTQEQLAELKEKYISLRLSGEEAERQHAQELEEKKQESTRLLLSHKQELEKCQAAYREKTLRLEEEMHKQRDRALAILAEKDQELEQIRSMPPPYGLQVPKSYVAARTEASPELSAGGFSQDNIAQVLQLNSTGEPTFFLYVEQLSRKEVEIGALRKQKHQLEMEVHQLQERLLVDSEQHRDELSSLQEQIQKSLRDKSREGANLEYLKNIVYRFLTLQDSLGRQQTLTAILTILHFSPEEKQVVMRHSVGGGWWPSSKR
ncbi:GRIP and coiled-coil domain-containing protein 1 [Rhinatrema bivittatum]|uniref:GRIP and coiled-coil domain-containing protein 1 n=1 Tax=Rhinatrema bivittatum TaxID=194408 RepID=UPI001125F183|nr:GRIP and coiled-coil domain-containing protein 1 [Rhinatrema bivittatum]XP_029471408.1 GRIP and coiled-coil domain-containing protein 1 [Rhinatrema bivittatum]XP_029471409.1 GRIP and coiled-coil domain-containing protein 1 [Rhinatrema bivittatum]XP_029471410.1 GRIP and coiled-coil domain-containing protein 1 [Rhinatrema bivittatum]XP_029471411.1 GRIP and coiled-coil domain-containing protein 1 [Rhinatrema bivittatum]